MVHTSLVSPCAVLKFLLRLSEVHCALSFIKTISINIYGLIKKSNLVVLMSSSARLYKKSAVISGTAQIYSRNSQLLYSTSEQYYARRKQWYFRIAHWDWRIHKIMLEAGNKASRQSYFSTLVLTWQMWVNLMIT